MDTAYKAGLYFELLAINKKISPDLAYKVARDLSRNFIYFVNNINDKDVTAKLSLQQIYDIIYKLESESTIINYFIPTESK